MARKSSIVAVALGFLLLVVAVLLYTVPVQIWVRAHLGEAFEYLDVPLAQLGLALWWWPILRRDQGPTGKALVVLSYLSAILVFVILFLAAGWFLIAAGDWRLLLGRTMIPALCVHSLAAACLVRRPRLMLSWVSGCILLSMCVFVLGLIVFFGLAGGSLA
jgi:hypothetical protein